MLGYCPHCKENSVCSKGYENAKKDCIKVIRNYLKYSELDNSIINELAKRVRKLKCFGVRQC